MEIQQARDRFSEWLLATDPGWLRLRLASRVTLTLGATLGLLYLGERLTGEPVTAAMFGVVVSMLSTFAVNDPNRHRRVGTMLLVVLPGAGGVAAGALLAPYRIAGDAVFVLIMFAAVYVRRFGPRGMTLGMVGYMTYFFSLFLGVKLAQLPWFVAAMVVGIVCSFAMAFWIMPDRPVPTLQRTLRAFGARLRRVVDQVLDLASGEGQASLDPLRRRVGRLNMTAQMVADQLEQQVDLLALWPGIDEHAFALRLFDAELDAEALASAGRELAQAGQDSNARRMAVQGLRTTRSALANEANPAPTRRAAQQLAALLDAPREDVDGVTGASRLLLESARNLLITMTDMRELVQRAGTRTVAAESDGTAGHSEADADQSDARASVRGSQEGGGLLPSTRQAIQVAVAGALAIVAGELISPRRWYWSAIAAFVIFAGTSSRGETLSKGWQRVLGTVGGVVCGMLVATAVNGNEWVSVVLIFVCLFFAFYLRPLAYGLMIFWITTLLALLYGLLGEFSLHLLLLRLEETAAGAVIGVLVALLVLPTSTRDTVRKGMDRFLRDLADLLGEIGERLAGAGSGRELTAAAGALRQQFQQLRDAAMPLAHGIAGAGSHDITRHALRALRACDRHARRLARLAAPPELGTDSAPCPDMTPVVRAVQHNITALADRISKGQPAPLQATDWSLDAIAGAGWNLDRSAHSTTPAVDALRALYHIDRAVVRLAIALGAADPEPPGGADRG